jgi:hypothetical protein
MMRIMLAAAVVIAALSFDLRPASAKEAPWCAVLSMGRGGAYWDCQYNSIEECRPNVIAGNRGFCNENPRFVAPSGPIKKFKVHRKHKVRND